MRSAKNGVAETRRQRGTEEDQDDGDERDTSDSREDEGENSGLRID